MKYTYTVDETFVVKIYEDGVEIFLRGPYTDYESADSWAKECVENLNTQKFDKRDFYGYERDYTSSDIVANTINRLIDERIDENNGNTNLVINGITWDFGKPSLRRAVIEAFRRNDAGIKNFFGNKDETAI